MLMMHTHTVLLGLIHSGVGNFRKTLLLVDIGGWKLVVLLLLYISGVVVEWAQPLPKLGHGVYIQKSANQDIEHHMG